MLPVDQGRGAFKLLENTDEIAGVHIAQLLGNLHDTVVAVAQPLLSPLHLVGNYSKF